MKQLTILLLILSIFSCKEKQVKKAKQEKNAGKIVEQARFVNNMIYLDLVTQEGDTLTFYTDTGGGKVVYPSTVEKLNIPIDSVEENGNVYETIDLSPTLTKFGIPPVIGTQMIYRGEQSGNDFNAGMLGGAWFDEKIWEFDYIKHKLRQLDTLDWSKLPSEHTVKLGFMRNDEGQHPTHFPRIPIIVDGDTLQTLLDTGAKMTLSKEAQTHFKGKKMVASSFIIASIFDKWQQKHPNWLVVAAGDSLLPADIIKVPEVVIGGHTVGPVWFAKRKDSNFTEWMSKWMDKPIVGAVGGSCFQYFNAMIIDYKAEKALFRK